MCSVKIQVQTRSFVLLSVSFSQVCDLLDLLGGSEETLQPSPAATLGLPTNTTSTAGGDLLDLLGGLEPTPLTPGQILTPAEGGREKETRKRKWF